MEQSGLEEPEKNMRRIRKNLGRKRQHCSWEGALGNPVLSKRGGSDAPERGEGGRILSRGSADEEAKSQVSIKETGILKGGCVPQARLVERNGSVAGQYSITSSAIEGGPLKPID